MKDVICLPDNGSNYCLITLSFYIVKFFLHYFCFDIFILITASNVQCVRRIISFWTFQLFDVVNLHVACQTTLTNCLIGLWQMTDTCATLVTQQNTQNLRQAKQTPNLTWKQWMKEPLCGSHWNSQIFIYLFNNKFVSMVVEHVGNTYESSSTFY